MKLPKIVIVLGPTASGKTDLSLALAKKFNGEIVSADSRQGYKKMNIGTAKPRADYRLKTKDYSHDVYLVDGIPHHIMDIIDPGKEFSWADFKSLAMASIKDILKRKKLPVIVGGTGLYIQTLVENLDIPKVEPNKKLREDLEEKTLPELVAMLVKMDPASAKKIDLKNSRRVLRALEVFMATGKSFFAQRTKSKPLYRALQIGIDVPREELIKRINTRVDKQINEGLVEETRGLAAEPARNALRSNAGGYKWSLPSMSGIGYKQMGFYLRGEMTLEAAIEILKRDTRRYAKRQSTWFKRDKKIVWIKNTNLALAEKLVKKFMA